MKPTTEILIAVIICTVISFGIIAGIVFYEQKETKEAINAIYNRTNEPVGKILEVIPIPAQGWGTINMTKVICEKTTVMIRNFPTIKLGAEGFIIHVRKKGFLCQEDKQYFIFTGTDRLFRINF